MMDTAMEEIHRLSEPLPSPFACPICGYDLAGSTVNICSECGHECSAGDVSRAGCAVLWKRVLRRQAIAVAVVALLVALFFLFLIPDLTAALLHALKIWLLVGWSISLGLVMAQAARKSERAGWRVSWLRAQLWLHMPWLGLPVFGAVMALAAQLGSESAAMIGTGGLLVWGVVSVAAIGGFLDRWLKCRRAYSLRDRTPVVYGPLIAFLVYLPSLWVGASEGFSMVVALESPSSIRR
jgi:hypothetical protein